MHPFHAAQSHRLAEPCEPLPRCYHSPGCGTCCPGSSLAHPQTERPNMKRLCCLTVSLLFAMCASASAQQLNYPPTRTVDAADTYFGKTYKDPYRWLEDLKDKEVEGWFKAQAELADRTLAAIPGRDALAAEWMALDKLRPVAYG